MADSEALWTQGCRLGAPCGAEGRLHSPISTWLETLAAGRPSQIPGAHSPRGLGEASGAGQGRVVGQRGGVPGYLGPVSCPPLGPSFLKFPGPVLSAYRTMYACVCVSHHPRLSPSVTQPLLTSTTVAQHSW